MSRRYNANKEVKKVTDINKEFIEEFIRTSATIADLIWLKDTKNACIATEEQEIRKNSTALSDEQITAKARRQYFGAFRSEFAKKFYSGLFAEKPDKKSVDTLALAIEARLSELSAAN